MEKIFYILLLLTFIHISTQFFYESKNNKVYYDGDDSCELKLKRHNKTIDQALQYMDQFEENSDAQYSCYLETYKRWNLHNVTHNDTHLPEKTDCCATYELYMCYEKDAAEICTPQEAKEVKERVEVFLLAHSAGIFDICSQWPFQSNECYAL